MVAARRFASSPTALGPAIPAVLKNPPEFWHPADRVACLCIGPPGVMPCAHAGKSAQTPMGAIMRTLFSRLNRCAHVSAMLCATGLPVGANAQLSETLGGRLEAQVFDAATGTWGSNVSVLPGSRVEFRYVVSYTGTNTNVIALGGITYQPTFSNADNTAADGSIDSLLPWRNGGMQGTAIANSMLSAAEGQSGAPLASYGRVVFGFTASNSSTQNRVTTHQHGGDFATANAPAGSWLRIAGTAVTTWPLAALSQAEATPANLNNINRGIISNQTSRFQPIGFSNTNWVTGTQNLVVFRGAIQLSELTDARTIALSSAAGSQQRIGAVNSANDTRYMSWYIDEFGSTIRVGVEVIPGSITVIPSPGVLALCGLSGAFFATRRRRPSCKCQQLAGTGELP